MHETTRVSIRVQPRTLKQSTRVLTESHFLWQSESLQLWLLKRGSPLRSCLVQSLSGAIRLATRMKGPTFSKSKYILTKNFSCTKHYPIIFLTFTVEPKFSVGHSSKLKQLSVPLDPSLVAPTLHRWPLRQLRREVRECHSEGRLTGGGLVNGRVPSADDAKYADRATRGDVIGWFDPEEWHHGKGLES